MASGDARLLPESENLVKNSSFRRGICIMIPSAFSLADRPANRYKPDTLRGKKWRGGERKVALFLLLPLQQFMQIRKNRLQRSHSESKYFSFGAGIVIIYVLYRKHLAESWLV